MKTRRTACIVAGLLASTAPVGIYARPVHQARATGTATIADRPAQVVVEVVRDVELKLLVSLSVPLVASINVRRPGVGGMAGLATGGFVTGEDLTVAPDVAVSLAEPEAEGAADSGPVIVLVQYN